MPFSPDARPPDTLCEARECPAEAVTATDLVISPPAYLQELHDALGRAERAYAGGDPAEAVRLAAEGLAMVRLAEAKLGAEAVPSHYRAFFHCLHAAPAFRAALAHFKRGLLCRQLPGSETEDAFRRAWQLFGPAVAGLEEDLAVERLTYDYPVAGRVLRAAARLREQLRARLRLTGGAAQHVGRQI